MELKEPLLRILRQQVPTRMTTGEVAMNDFSTLVEQLLSESKIHSE